MCSLRKGVTVFPINNDDMFVMLSRGRSLSSSSGRRRSQLLAVSGVTVLTSVGWGSSSWSRSTGEGGAEVLFGVVA